jgi:methylmalonyl-CoA mutase N-terminal domain/subunit
MTREATSSGIPLQAAYDAVQGPEHDLGAPGAFPFARGIYPNMYRGR